MEEVKNKIENSIDSLLQPCKICGGTRRVKINGIYVECECVKRAKRILAGENAIVKPVITATKAVKEQLVASGVICAERIDDDWDEKTLEDNIKIYTGEYRNQVSFSVPENFKREYVKEVKTILATLKAGDKLKSSYLLGASNGFGKTTLANTIIKITKEHGGKVVPYVSLFEIAQIKKKVAKSFSLCSFTDESETDKDEADERVEIDESLEGYKYIDFVNADNLVCYLSDCDQDSACVEWFTLQSLIRERSAKGKATIVTMEVGIQWYYDIKPIRIYVMNEMLAHPGMTKLDRLVYKFIYLKNITAGM